MKGILTVFALALICGCILGSGGKNVEVVDVGGVNDTGSLAAAPTTTVKISNPSEVTSSTVPVTSTSATTTSTTSSSTTSTTRTTTTSTTVKTTTTTSTSTSTTSTIKCSQECYDIRLPSPQTCRLGCCISNDTRCVYQSSINDGPACRCR